MNAACKGFKISSYIINYYFYKILVEDDTLTGTAASVDDSTKENLNKLVEIGEKLLKKPVSRVNLQTGYSEPVKNCGTNEEALRMYEKEMIELALSTTHFIIRCCTHSLL